MSTEAVTKDLDDHLDNVTALMWSSDPNSSYDMYTLLEKLSIEKYGHAKGLHKLRDKPVKIQTTESVTEDLMDFFEDDLMCVVCSDITVSYRNQLMECDKCHLIYHQNCHEPPIKDVKMGVPWTCHKCLSLVNTPQNDLDILQDQNDNKNGETDEIGEITKFLQKVKSTPPSSKEPKKLGKKIVQKLFGDEPIKVNKPEPSVTKAEPERRKSLLSLKRKENIQPQNSVRPSTSKETKPKVDTPGAQPAKSNFRNAGPTINIVSAEKRLYYIKKRAAESSRLRRQ